MALTFVVYTADGINRDYTFSFDYLSEDHLVVTLDEVVTTSWSLLTPTTVRVTSIPAEGTHVKIARQTPTEPLVDYTSGSLNLASTLNKAYLHTLYAVEEALDAIDFAELTTEEQVFEAVQDGIDEAATRILPAITNPDVGKLPVVVSGMSGAEWALSSFIYGDNIVEASVAPPTITYTNGTTFGVSFSSQKVKTTGPSRIMVTCPGSSRSKTTGAWALGTGTGALDAGTVANSTPYAVFIITDTLGSTVDLLLSLSPTNPTLPVGFSNFRRIGWIVTDGSGNIRPFDQIDDEFRYRTPVVDRSPSNITGGHTQVVSIPPRSVGDFWVNGTAASGTAILSVGVLDYTTAAPVTVVGTTLGGVRVKQVVDDSSQIMLNVSDVSSTIGVTTVGWTDRRGKDK